MNVTVIGMRVVMGDDDRYQLISRMYHGYITDISRIIRMNTFHHIVKNPVSALQYLWLNWV